MAVLLAIAVALPLLLAPAGLAQLAAAESGGLAATPRSVCPELVFSQRWVPLPRGDLVRERANLVQAFQAPEAFVFCSSLDGPSCSAGWDDRGKASNQGNSEGELDASPHLQHFAELEITETDEDFMSLVLQALAGGGGAGGGGRLDHGAAGDVDPSDPLRSIVAELLQSDEFVRELRRFGEEEEEKAESS